MERNSFLISRAFRNYLKAALLSSACMQLTVMLDAMVAGHFIGSDALSAINLSMPLVTFVIALSTLIGIGPAIMAAKYIGSRQTEKVNSVFSSAMYQSIIIGVLQGIILYLLLPQVGGWLCSNGRLLPVVMEYIQVFPFTFFLMMNVYTLVSLIEADGHPQLAAKAVVLGSILNVVLDVVLVKCFDIGILGLALAMLANYLSVLLYFLARMKREGISYQWIRPKKNIINVTLAGLKEGMPVMINDLIYSLMLFSTNTMLLIYYGEEELYFWAIFLQFLLMVMVIVDCAEGAVLSIGSVLKGEDDWFGLRSLIKRILILISGIVLLVVVCICLFPNQIAMFFSDRSNIPENWPKVVRILSLMLVPYALTTFLRSVFQLLGNRMLGVFFSLGHLALIVILLYLSARWDALFLWWSFPIASWTLLVIQILYMLIEHHRKQNSDFTFTPLHSKKDYLELSVAYNKASVVEAIQRVCRFLQEHKVHSSLEMEVNICCEELMMNIVLFQTYKSRSYMDLSVVLEEHSIFLVLKDAGRPFNPVLASNTSDILKKVDGQLGLYLVNQVCSKLSHKYMYGLNVVFADFDKNTPYCTQNEQHV